MSRFAAALLSGAAYAALCGTTVAQELSPLGPDEMMFSVENMDTSVDPSQDFYRYASGRWLDRVERPSDRASWGVFEIMTERLIKQMAAAAAEAGQAAAGAPKGSAVQLVGDFYNAYMDVEAIDASGIEPVRGLLDRIEAIASLDDMIRFMAEQAVIAGPSLFAVVAPSTDPADSKRYAMFVVGQSFGVDEKFLDIYRNAQGDPRVDAYRTYVEDVMTIAGYAPADAARIAETTLKIEFALYAGLLTPEEANDPRNRYAKKTYDEVQALIPALDLDLYLDTIGFAKPDAFYMFEPRALQALAELWRTTSLGALKDYAAFRVIDNYKPFLTTALDAPAKALDLALVGASADRPRQDRLYRLFIDTLGHPASRIYVDAHFSEETRADVLDMVERIHAVFRSRIKTREWLSEETRAQALEKAAKFYYKVGYPDKWIDFSSVDIGPDPVANMMNLGAFSMARLAEKLKHPVEHDEFNASSTLPIAVNAAYNPSINGFEVSAAIVQPPAYVHDMDAPLRFCRTGAIIGHEMTHGFDSGGRRYDANGNFRDWWTPQDAEAFEAEAQKLIDQANAFEVLPGLHANGPLNVRENMADVGGITFAYEALMTYLDEHPQENVEIDGFTPAQRCFLGWAQLWTMKAAEPYLRAIVAGNGHPPNFYRTVAALQHVDAFYEAFGIEEGDPMWLPPAKRVHAW